MVSPFHSSVQGGVQEADLGDGFVVQQYLEGMVPGGLLELVSHKTVVFGGDLGGGVEGDAGPCGYVVRQWKDFGRPFPGEVGRGEGYLPGGAVGCLGADGYLAVAGQGVEAHAGGVFVQGMLLGPVGLAEGKECPGVVYSLAVVGCGDGAVAGGDEDPGGIGPAAVLQEFVEDVLQAGVEEVADPDECVLVY